MLGFDVSSIQSRSGDAHGGGEYALSLLRSLLRKASAGNIKLFLRSDWPVPDAVEDLIREYGAPVQRASSEAQMRAAVCQADLTAFYSALPEFRGLGGLKLTAAEFVVTQHGLRDLECPIDRYAYKYARSPKDVVKYILKTIFPKFFQNREIRFYKETFLAENSSTKIIVPSWHTYYSVLSYFPRVSPQRLKVFYAPPTAMYVQSGTDAVLDKFDLKNKDYIFLVSGNRWEKNAWRSITALAKAIESSPHLSEMKIVVAGGSPPSLPSWARKNLISLPYLSYEELAGLYAKSFCFLYPSLNEGFGYPPVEAMAHGAPVVASGVSAIAEVSSYGADYFDPYNGNEMVSRILRLKLDSSYRLDLLRRGEARFNELYALQKKSEDDLSQYLIELSKI